MTTRREFLVNCSAAVITAAVVPGMGLAANHLKGNSSKGLSYSTFVSQIETTFVVCAPSREPVSLKLVEASRWPVPSRKRSPVDGTQSEQFVLRFSAPGQELLPQCTCRFEHQDIGSFMMFIVPTPSKDGAGSNYIAVVNRMRSGAKQVERT